MCMGKTSREMGLCVNLVESLKMAVMMCIMKEAMAKDANLLFQRVHRMFQENRMFTISSELPEVSRSVLYYIITEELGYKTLHTLGFKKCSWTLDEWR